MRDELRNSIQWVVGHREHAVSALAIGIVLLISSYHPLSMWPIIVIGGLCAAIWFERRGGGDASVRKGAVAHDVSSGAGMIELSRAEEFAECALIVLDEACRVVGAGAHGETLLGDGDAQRVHLIDRIERSAAQPMLNIIRRARRDGRGEGDVVLGKGMYGILAIRYENSMVVAMRHVEEGCSR